MMTALRASPADFLSYLGISACQNWFQLGICIDNGKEAETSACTLACWVLTKKCSGFNMGMSLWRDPCQSCLPP